MKQTKIARNIWLGIENLVGEGASEEAMARIRKLGSDNIILTSVKSAQEEARSTQRSNMSIYGLTYADYRRISESFPNVLRVAPAKLLRKESRLRERSMELRVVGATPDWFQLVPRTLVAGRVIRQEDQDKRAPVAILTEYGARKLLATQGSVGQTLRIGGKEFEVVGIIQSEGGQSGSVQVPDQEIDVYIPLEVAQRYYGDIFTKRTSGSQEREKVELHQVIVQVDDPKNAESVAAAIERMLERFHKKKDYAVSVPLALLKQAEATKRTFNIVLRHRHHEHHAGRGDRADAGNRHPSGDRRQTTSDCFSVPDRNRGALDVRRPDRPGHRGADSVSDHALLGDGDGDEGVLRRAAAGDQHEHWNRIRPVPGASRREGRSNRCVETRIEATLASFERCRPHRRGPGNFWRGMMR